VKLDVSLAVLYKDSVHIKLRDIQSGNKGLAISFTHTEDVSKSENLSLSAVLKSLPSSVPVDEFRLQIEKEEQKTEDVPSVDEDRQKTYNLCIAIIILVIFILFVLTVIFSIPYTIFVVYARRAKRISDPKRDAYYPYRAAMFLMYQMGYFRNDLTPLQYAGQVIDKNLGTSFGAFTATYLKVKYANQELTNEDSQRILTFYTPFEQAIKSKISRKKRLLRFMNIYNTLEFFTKPRQPD
jgi:hypothetical protein